MKRQGSAEWKGNLQQGQGTVSSTSGVLKNTPYSFRSRFADGTEEPRGAPRPSRRPWFHPDPAGPAQASLFPRPLRLLPEPADA